MRVEFTSLFDPAHASVAKADVFPVAALLRHAAFLDDGGIDNLRIASGAAPVNRAAFIVLENAPNVGAVLPFRAGDLSPVEAAEQFGLFDQLSNGQLTLVVDPPPAGAFAEKHGAHEHAMQAFDEYLTLLKRLWASDEPIDFEGGHYRLKGASCASKPFNRKQVRLALAGRSGTAIQIAAKHADVFELTAPSVSGLRDQISRIRNAAMSFGRAARLELSLAVAPIIASSREAVRSRLSALADIDLDDAPQQHRLVGTAHQVALQFVSLIDLGVTGFTLHGLTDEEQLLRFTSEVLPLVRNAAARQEARTLGDMINGTGQHGIYPAALR